MSKATTQAVREVIKRLPETKDNNRLLVIQVWKLQLREIGITGYLEFRWFEKHYLSGHLSNAESIIRIKNRLS